MTRLHCGRLLGPAGRNSRNTFALFPPADRDAAAGLKLQGQAPVWADEHAETVLKSRRLMSAGKQGLVVVGDSWNWPEEKWLSALELSNSLQVAPGVASLVAQTPHPTLAAEVLQAMQVPTELRKGHWVTKESIFQAPLTRQQKEAWLLHGLRDEVADLRGFGVVNEGGGLEEDASAELVQAPTQCLTPIVVITQGQRHKWLSCQEAPEFREGDGRHKVWPPGHFTYLTCPGGVPLAGKVCLWLHKPLLLQLLLGLGLHGIGKVSQNLGEGLFYS